MTSQTTSNVPVSTRLALAIRLGSRTQRERNVTEEHEKQSQGAWLRDVILGGQDGLVNVLGIVLGLAAASAATKIIILAGMAATFAESVSMGAVAYTSSLAERDHYLSEAERERREMRE